MTKRSWRGEILALSLGFLAAGLISAGEPDLLQDAKRRREAAAQRLENEVRQGIFEASRLQLSQPAKGADMLRALLREVEDDIDLAPDRRASLRQKLQANLRRLDRNAGRNPSYGVDETSSQAGVRRTPEQRRRDELEQLSQQVQRIGELRRAGRFDEANRLSTELAARYPDNAAVMAAVRTGMFGSRVSDARSQRIENGERLLGVGRDIDKSSTLPIDEMELPRDWREKSQRRSPGKKLTEKEKTVLKALESPIRAELTGTFSQAIDYLQTATGLTIVVDGQALKEANITSDTPVNLKLRTATTRTVLKKLLAEFDLAYIVKDEAIQVTTIARARDSMTTRTYYIGDLTGVTNLRLGPLYNQAQALQTISAIVEMIQGQIDPASWRANGGSGTITFEPLTMSLVVRQTAEIHMMMNSIR